MPVGDFGTRSRVEGGGCNEYMYKYHFYNLLIATLVEWLALSRS